MNLRVFLFTWLLFCGMSFGQNDNSKIHQTIQGLRSYHYAHQKAAIQKLVKMGEPAIPELLKSLRTASELRFKEGLRLALAKQGQKVIPHILEELEAHPDSTLNMMASLVLMPQIEQDITELILPRLDTGSDVQKMYILNILSKMSQMASYRKAMSAIAEAATDKKITVKMQALIALRSFTAQAEEVIPILIEAAKDHKVKRIALESMGKMSTSNDKMLKLLVENLEGNHQSTAALSLIAIGSQADVFLLKQLQNSANTHKQKLRILDILVATTRQGEELKSLRHSLLPLLKDRQICQKVLQVFRVVGTPSGASPQIILCLKEPEFRYEAIQVLGQIKENIAENASHLIPLLQEKQSRLIVLSALHEMGEPANQAVPHLLELLAEDSPELHRRIGKTLKKMGTKAIDDLGFLLQNSPFPRGLFTAIREMGKDAAPLVPYMLMDINNKSENKLVEILGALSKIRKNIYPSLGIISKLLTHSNPQVQNLAIEVVGKLGPQAKSLVPNLVELLPSAQPAIAFQILTALGRIGASAEPALPALKKLRQTTKDPYIRAMIPSVQKRILDQIKEQNNDTNNKEN